MAKKRLNGRPLAEARSKPIITFDVTVFDEFWDVMAEHKALPMHAVQEMLDQWLQALDLLRDGTSNADFGQVWACVEMNIRVSGIEGRPS